MKNLIIAGTCTMLLLAASPLMAQITVTIQGPTSVTAYVDYTYTIEFRDNGNVIDTPEGAFEWLSTAATIISESESSVTLQWTATGTQFIYYSFDLFGNFYEDDLYVTVAAGPPPTPNAAFGTPSQGCGSTTVTRTTSPPPYAGYDWYWQTSASGTSTALGNGTSVNLTSTSNLYLRARLSASPYTWSTNSQSAGSITVYNTPPTPTVANDAAVFQGANITVSVGTVAGASSYVWYDGGVAVSGQTSNSYLITGLSSTKVFQVVSKSGPCESAGSLAVTATIEPKPVIQGVSHTTMGVSPVLSTTTSGYTQYEWILWNGTTETVKQTSASSSYQTEGPGIYRVRVTKTGVMGNSTSADFVVGSELDGLNMNYIVTNAIQTPGVTDMLSVSSLPVSNRSQSIQYFDGLGRPIQSVATQGSPGKNDIVQAMTYDQYGREAVKYLPYTSTDADGWYKTNAVGAPDTNEIPANYSGSPQYQFYQNNPTTIAQDTKPFAVTRFEPSPLNRVLKQGAPGAAWQPNDTLYSTNDHTVKNRYEFNSASDVVLFEYDAATEALTNTGYYEANQLMANKTIDEHNNEVIEYVDKQGRTVLKKVQYKEESGTKHYAETYYIYDDFGQLVLVLPPEFVAQMGTMFNEN